jgi:hypothetical protein
MSYTRGNPMPTGPVVRPRQFPSCSAWADGAARCGSVLRSGRNCRAAHSPAGGDCGGRPRVACVRSLQAWSSTVSFFGQCRVQQPVRAVLRARPCATRPSFSPCCSIWSALYSSDRSGLARCGQAGATRMTPRPAVHIRIRFSNIARPSSSASNLTTGRHARRRDSPPHDRLPAPLYMCGIEHSRQRFAVTVDATCLQRGPASSRCARGFGH